ncbi:MAG: hypothetical protein FK733_14465 [Asgard group archaeon]|nr:hypothetical protein [Asgard group archaeon]
MINKEGKIISKIILNDDYWDVYITSDAFLSLLGPVIENYYEETGGIIVGSIGRRWIDGENRPAIVITSIFPSVTARITSGEWEPNLAAQKRLQGFAESFNLKILGEYHSHPDDTAELSDEDEEYIRESWKELQKTSSDQIVDEEGKTFGWLELILRVKKEEYKKKRVSESKWWTPNESNKIRGKISIGEKFGFDITIGAFVYIPEDDDFYELPIFSEICSSYER